MNNSEVKTAVVVSKFAEKQLQKMPKYIRESLRNWITAVGYLGIRDARKISGFHDEPLHGDRIGQRSVRLNRSYRALYIETIQGLELLVIEVSKHDY